MILLSILGLISSLGAVAALVLLPCREDEPEEDFSDGMAAWPDASFQSGREI